MVWEMEDLVVLSQAILVASADIARKVQELLRDREAWSLDGDEEPIHPLSS